jgi:tetratricopeptide (TPR) repeat protein
MATPPHDSGPNVYNVFSVQLNGGVMLNLTFRLAMATCALFTINAFAQETSWRNLHLNAVDLYGQRKYKEAEVVARRALDRAEKDRNPDHPQVADSCYWLAAILEAQGKCSEAQEFSKKALLIRQKTLPPHYIDVVSGLHQLGNLYAAQGKHSEAKKLFEKALKDTEKGVGSDHFQVSICLEKFGKFYQMTCPPKTGPDSKLV